MCRIKDSILTNTNAFDTMFNSFKFADMAELADAPDLGSGGRPCRFDSCYPHKVPDSGTFLFFYRKVRPIEKTLRLRSHCGEKELCR